jgi:hypothetical protein
LRYVLSRLYKIFSKRGDDATCKTLDEMDRAFDVDGFSILVDKLTTEEPDLVSEIPEVVPVLAHAIDAKARAEERKAAQDRWVDGQVRRMEEAKPDGV